MPWPALALLMVGAGVFVFLLERARRIRKEGGFTEDLAPPLVRVVTIGAVVLSFALQGSRWELSRSLAVGLVLASVGSSQVVMWVTTSRRGAPFSAAALESGAMGAVLAAAFGAHLLR